MQNEANLLIAEFLSNNGKAFDPCDIITKAVGNIILMLVVNKRWLLCNIRYYVIE